jgi:hypothetical protein
MLEIDNDKYREMTGILKGVKALRQRKVCDSLKNEFSVESRVKKNIFFAKAWKK